MENHLKSCGMKTEIRHISPALTQNAWEIADLMYHDKKASGKAIGFILVREIGNAFQSTSVDMDDVRKVIEASF